MSNGDLGQIFGSAFDSNQYEPMKDYEPLPPGKYQVVVEKAEVKVTKAETGRYIKLEMLVVNDPKYNNRKLFDNINIFNPSTVCMEIGLRVLTALAQAANIPVVEDSSQLVGCNVVAHVKVGKDGQNNIRTYSAVQLGQSGASLQGHAPPQGPAQSALPRPIQQPARFVPPSVQPSPQVVQSPPVAPPPPAARPGQAAIPQQPQQQPVQGQLPWARN